MDTSKLSIFTVGKYLAEFENDILEAYVTQWKNEKNRPDIIVNDFFVLGGISLSEIYNIQNVFVAQNFLPLILINGEDFFPEYGKMYIPNGVFQPTDNSFLRALRYLVKKILNYLGHWNANKDRSATRSKYGLPPYSSATVNSFYIIESFFGLQSALLLPPYIELVGFLESKNFNSPLNPEIKDWINNSKGFIYIYRYYL